MGIEDQILKAEVVYEKKNEVVKAEEFGLEPDKVKEVESVFLPVIAEREKLEESYKIIINEDMTPERAKSARELRLKLVKVRTGTDKIHKKAKAFYRAGGLFVDAWKNKNVEVIKQMESNLNDIETYYDNLEKERIAKLQQSRWEELSKYGEYGEMDLGNLTDDVWENFIAGARLQHEAKVKAEEEEIERRRLALEEAEKKRLEFIKKEEEEREKQRLENERLRKEAEVREKQMAEERAKVEAERIEREKKEKAERERVEEEARIKLEKIRAEREKREEEIRIKLDTEKKEREKLEAELKAKKVAEEKRIADEQKKIHEAKEAQEKLDTGSDKSKWTAYVEQIEAIAVPVFKTKKYSEKKAKLDAFLMVN